MRGLFGDPPVTGQLPGTSEAVGHLDVLEERGTVVREERVTVVREEREGTVVYERTDTG